MTEDIISASLNLAREESSSFVGNGLNFLLQAGRTGLNFSLQAGRTGLYFILQAGRTGLYLLLDREDWSFFY